MKKFGLSVRVIFRLVCFSGAGIWSAPGIAAETLEDRIAILKLRCREVRSTLREDVRLLADKHRESVMRASTYVDQAFFPTRAFLEERFAEHLAEARRKMARRRQCFRGNVGLELERDHIFGPVMVLLKWASLQPLSVAALKLENLSQIPATRTENREFLSKIYAMESFIKVYLATVWGKLIRRPRVAPRWFSKVWSDAFMQSGPAYFSANWWIRKIGFNLDVIFFSPDSVGGPGSFGTCASWVFSGLASLCDVLIPGGELIPRIVGDVSEEAFVGILENLYEVMLEDFRDIIRAVDALLLELDPMIRRKTNCIAVASVPLALGAAGFVAATLSAATSWIRAKLHTKSEIKERGEAPAKMDHKGATSEEKKRSLLGRICKKLWENKFWILSSVGVYGVYSVYSLMSQLLNSGIPLGHEMDMRVAMTDIMHERSL